MRNSKSNGVVYVFFDADKGCKIGSSCDVKRRLSNIRCGNPDVEVVFQSDLLINRVDVEKMAHSIAKDYRVKGEWFSCSASFAIDCVKKSQDSIGNLCEASCDSEVFLDKLDFAKLQATGILARVLAKEHVDIIDGFKSKLEASNLKHLSCFIKKQDHEQLLEASVGLANDFLTKQNQISNRAN